MKQYQSKNAFTLVELLIVISIIALLLSILVPSLARARSQAKRVICQTRLKQWGYAFEIYAQQNNNFYPHIDSANRPANDIADDFGWVDVLPPLMDEKPWRDYELYKKPGQNTIFQCPSAKILPDGYYNYKPSKNGYFSYAMNSCLELDENCYIPVNTPVGKNNYPSFLNITKIKQPAKLIVLFDQLIDPRKAYNNTTYSYKTGRYCGSYPKYFSARHALRKSSLGGSVLLADYHIEFRETIWKDEWDDRTDAPPTDDLEWYPY